MEKESYIKEQVNIDYVLKSKNSALAFLCVSVLFSIFLLRIHHSYTYYILLLVALVMVVSFIRLLAVNNYLSKKNSLRESVLEVSTTALLNGILWGIIGVLSILSFGENNFQILVTFIVLISFGSGAIVTLSHKRFVFIPVTYLVLFPQIFYSFQSYIKSNDVTMLWLMGYSIINILYNFRQGRVVQKELHQRFSSEFDVKQSLEEIALSKKHLEEESVKTFHASRLSSLGQMAGSVAHEINNPLTIIQGMSKSILSHNEGALDEQTISKLNKITSASERIARIVKGMKIISSKNDQIEHETIKVSKIIELSLGLFEERLKNESVRFQLENVTDPLVFCNSLQISQILINLISNALDAMKKHEGEKDLVIKVTEDFLHHNVDIRVINSGPLLKFEVSSKLFEPFFTTKTLGQGTGLGLSISQTLAHSNGGTLTYEDYQGHVCFRLHLETHSL
jgi:signal transduction histidine kinase